MPTWIFHYITSYAYKNVAFAYIGLKALVLYIGAHTDLHNELPMLETDLSDPLELLKNWGRWGVSHYAGEYNQMLAIGEGK